ncbi:MAG: sulfotransferase, partial [Verrucomicrobia bacterium]|nr:sulfotransferase [Verrucomicrobiota bacterium]
MSDFGDDSFREPYELLLKSLQDEARLNTQGVIMLQRTILRLLVNRLLTEQAFAANPEMAETPIDRPLYILGFPRTGTTLLHSLLACDPASRWLRLWEGLHPAPAPESLQDDPRIATTRDWVAGFEKLVPNLARAHKLDATGPEECLWLIEHTFADLIFELRAHVPSYSKWLV